MISLFPLVLIPFATTNTATADVTSTAAATTATITAAAAAYPRPPLSHPSSPSHGRDKVDTRGWYENRDIMKLCNPLHPVPHLLDLPPPPYTR